jgi:hypothetical protein
MEEEALEVGGFRVIDVDRVVEGLTVLLENTHPSPRFESRLENDLLKEPFVDEMGTRKGQDQPRGANPLEGQAVDVLVATAGGDDVGPFLGERRRIEDDEIVVERRFPEELEDVRREEKPRIGRQAAADESTESARTAPPLSAQTEKAPV